jgi:3-phenylpropionate/trans-cinnamate dioxygenase ferredoxin reductase component
MEKPVVVVGAGLAAAKCVENLRKEGFAGSITLIGAERYRPYDRPGLSKEVLQGKAEPESLFLHAAHFYSQASIQTHFGDRAVRLDRDAQTVFLASGLEVPYDRLVLATGSRARWVDLPGAGLAGILTLRTMDDEVTLRAALEAKARLVAVGGGWIGLEVAAAAVEAGCRVTVLEGAKLPLASVLGEELAGYFARLHRGHGVDLRTDVKVAGFEGADGKVTGVRVGDEVIPADVVLVGIGAAPNTELAEAAGLAVDNGVIVDERLRTEDPRIWAAGDVANAFNPTLGRHLRVEHWDNARRQGRFAALSVLGREGSYDWQPYFYTDQYDLSMEYVGNAGRGADVRVRGDLAGGAFIAFWLEAGLVTAAMNVNTPKVNPTLRKIVGKTVDPARLSDPAVELSDLI